MVAKVRRALLFMPGDDRRKIEKGASLGVDSVIMDLEDGVALNNKPAARTTVLHALREVSFGHTERLIRINPVMNDPAWWQQDLEETIEGNPNGYMIPKVEHADQIKQVADFLAKAERKYGWMDGGIRIIALVETALGIVNLKEIATSDARLSALAFGAEDLAGDIGAIRTPDGWEVFYGRSAVVLHAKAHHLEAIDTPFVDLNAEDSHLIADTEQAHYMGFTGKLAIHPRHVPVIQRIFTPSDDQIRSAKALITAHDEHQAAGQGVFEWEGKMVDMPMIRAAQYILARAKAAGVDINTLE